MNRDYVRNSYIRIGCGGVGERFSATSSKESGKLKMAGGYLSDHLGSTTLLVNESDLEVERTEYFPYGQVQSGGLEKYGFTGQENDADTWLMYYGAKYYSPEYRIFVQPDTMLPDPYNPQALNRYAYALNKPVKYTDPRGNIIKRQYLF
jgi:RHS repeat-associated protein